MKDNQEEAEIQIRPLPVTINYPQYYGFPVGHPSMHACMYAPMPQRRGPAGHSTLMMLSQDENENEVEHLLKPWLKQSADVGSVLLRWRSRSVLAVVLYFVISSWDSWSFSQQVALLSPMIASIGSCPIQIVKSHSDREHTVHSKQQWWSRHM